MLGTSSSRRVYYANPGEVLSGKVNGDDASDIEERAAKYHQKNQVSFWFRLRINPLATRPPRELSKRDKAILQYGERVEKARGVNLPKVFQEERPDLLTSKKHNIIGELEIDILSTYNGVMYPIMIQGEISHYMTPAQKEKDIQKIARIDNILMPLGIHPAVIIPFWHLRDQTATDRVMRNGYATGWSMKLDELE